MIRKQQFNGVPFNGIIHQTAQRVDMGNTRGIVFNRPERYIVNTPVGQLEITNGDWLVEFTPGRYYVIRAVDMVGVPQPKKSWWRNWISYE